MLAICYVSCDCVCVYVNVVIFVLKWKFYLAQI